MTTPDKPLVWLKSEVKTPRFSTSARLEAGMLLRRLQRGERLGLPHSRPMPGIRPRRHELRIRDESRNRRILYRFDEDPIVVVGVYQKTTRATPGNVIRICQDRLKSYDT